MKETVKRVLQTRDHSQIRLSLLVFIVITSVLSIIVYLKTVENSNITVKTQSSEKLLLLARAGAYSYENFLNITGAQIKQFSQMKEIKSHEINEAESIFKSFITSFSSPLVAIALFDSNGRLIVIANEDDNKGAIGENFSDRDYFKWAQKPENKDRLYYSLQFTSRAGITTGRKITVVASPVYSDKFAGVVLGVIDVGEAISKFINPLKSPQIKVVIVDSGGNLALGDPNSEGKNLNEFAKMEEEEGSVAWDSRIAAFKTMKIGGETSKIVIISPKNSVEDYLAPVVSVQNFGLLLILFAFVGVGLLSVIADYSSHKEGYLKGYKKALEELNPKKK